MNIFEHKKIKYIAVCIFASSIHIAMADDYFPYQLLKIENAEGQSYSNEDLSIFNRSDIPPGHYTFDIFLNSKILEKKKIEMFSYQDVDNKEKLLPCFTEKEFYAYGIQLPANVKAQANNGQCIALDQIPYFKYTIDLSNNALNLLLPQSYIDEKQRIYFEKKSWDTGLPALIFAYDLSRFDSRRDDRSLESYYGNIRSSVNLAAWRYDNYLTWNRNTQGKSDWNVLTQTLSTIIKPINSDLILGDTYSSGAVFNSIKLRGAKLQSSQLMRSNLYNTYAPSIQGLADTDAVLTITQNGNIIYRKSIQAGPFNITDYYPLGNGGNLYVDVMGSDGNKKSFVVPFSSLNVLERKGSYQYSVASGQYQGQAGADNTYVNQMDMSYGLSNLLTATAGTQVSSPYQAYAVGTGFNLGNMGALSLDVIHARTQLRNSTASGQSFKVNYSKSFLPTGTNFSLLGYKYFDQNYYSFNEAMNVQNQDAYNKIKSELTATMSQSFSKGWGSFNLSSTFYDYQNGQRSRLINAAYTNAYQGANYSLYYTLQQDNRYSDVNKMDYSLGLSVSMPLFENRRKNYSSVSYSVSTNKDNNVISNVGVSGTAGERNQANWNVFQAYDNKANEYFGGLNGAYQSQYAKFNGAYNYSENMQNLNLGLSGAVIATQYGVLMTQPIYGTNALVRVDQAAGVSVVNSTAAVTNSSGLALVTGLQPYRENSISIDPKTIPDDIELESTVLNRIIPTQGALTLANFKAQKGYKLLFNLKDLQGEYIPFGAQASINQGAIAWVSNFGQLFILSHAPQEKIQVEWVKDGIQQSCELAFDLQGLQPINGLYMDEKQCSPKPNQGVKQ